MQERIANRPMDSHGQILCVEKLGGGAQLC